MEGYGTLHEVNGRYALRFERSFSQPQKEVFRVLTDPVEFPKWYPFATGEMDLRAGGKIHFDDEEGSVYEATITELDPPHRFGFLEIDDAVDIEVIEEGQGSRMIFTHTFDDPSWAVATAAGWHGCLDVLGQIINGEPAEWNDNSAVLRKIYGEKFQMESE